MFDFYGVLVYVSLARDYHTSAEIRREEIISPELLQRKCVDVIEKRLDLEYHKRFPSETRVGYLREMLALAQGDWNDVNTIKALYQRYGEIQWPRWDKERRKARDLENLFEPQD